MKEEPSPIGYFSRWFSFPFHDFMNCIASLPLATQLQYTLQESVLHLIKRSDLMCSYSSTGDTESGGSTARVPLEPALYVDSMKVYMCVYIVILRIYIYIYAQTGTFADPTVQRFKLFFPFECGVRFFFGFQEAFSSCGSSQSSASGWKAFEGLTLLSAKHFEHGLH